MSTQATATPDQIKEDPLSLKKLSAGSVYELIAVPAVLVVAGFAILRWVDGEWWGVALWILVSPLIYFLIDLVFFGRLRATETGDSKRIRTVKSPYPAGPAAPIAPPTPDWESARDVSTGAEILRRGRRYDHRA